MAATACASPSTRSGGRNEFTTKFTRAAFPAVASFEKEIVVRLHGRTKGTERTVERGTKGGEKDGKSSWRRDAEAARR